ncbi:MAG TPA: hypothetical protein VKA32_08490 [Gammaproteobacteria bacterium]|nr:hypothetical protein [Gammaproteobacteria bacterium]
MQESRDRFYPSRDPATGLEEDQNHFLSHARISLGLPSLFYASLRDPRVFEAVAGRPMETTHQENVAVPGYSTFEVDAGTGYPGIFYKDADTVLHCLLISDLTPFEQTMVAWFEWNEYELQEFPLSDGRSAQAFIPDLDAIRRTYGEFDMPPWSFETWRTRSLEESVVTARDWMMQRPSNEALVEAGCFAMDDVSARSRGG